MANYTLPMTALDAAWHVYRRFSVQSLRQPFEQCGGSCGEILSEPSLEASPSSGAKASGMLSRPSHVWGTRDCTASCAVTCEAKMEKW